MGSIEEKRVFDDSLSVTRLIATSSLGITYINVVDDRIGEFGLLHNAPATDITQTPTGVAVATIDDVVLVTGTNVHPTEFGPAAAVTWTDSGLTAVDDTGGVATCVDGEWGTIGTIPSPVNTMDDGFAATDDGIYRLTPDLPHVGLSGVRDISAEPIPLAATTTGLFELGNGWHKVVDDEFCVVATGVHDEDSWAYAATPSALYERADVWREIDHPFSDPIRDATFTELPFFITTTGVLGVKRSEWHTTALGLLDVTGIASAGFE